MKKRNKEKVIERLRYAEKEELSQGNSENVMSTWLKTSLLPVSYLSTPDSCRCVHLILYLLCINFPLINCMYKLIGSQKCEKKKSSISVIFSDTSAHMKKLHF